MTRDTAEALRQMKYAIVHRYVTMTDRDVKLDEHSSDLIYSTVRCLSLIRPTKKGHAEHLVGVNPVPTRHARHRCTLG